MHDYVIILNFSSPKKPTLVKKFLNLCLYVYHFSLPEWSCLRPCCLIDCLDQVCGELPMSSPCGCCRKLPGSGGSRSNQPLIRHHCKERSQLEIEKIIHQGPWEVRIKKPLEFCNLPSRMIGGDDCVCTRRCCCWTSAQSQR